MTTRTMFFARTPGSRIRAAATGFRRYVAGGCLLAMLLAGCASLTAGDYVSETASRNSMVVVENATLGDLVVYLSQHGTRLRLATVPAASTEEIEVPNALIGSGFGTRLLARSSASTHYIDSGPFTFIPGEAYLWRIGAASANLIAH